MASPDFNLCDICREHVDVRARTFIADGNEDGECTGRCVDLCPRCAGSILNTLSRESHLVGKAILKQVDKGAAVHKKRGT